MSVIGIVLFGGALAMVALHRQRERSAIQDPLVFGALEADQAFPPDRVLESYRKALLLYRSGKPERAFRLMASLTDKPITAVGVSLNEVGQNYDLLCDALVSRDRLFQLLRRYTNDYALRMASRRDYARAMDAVDLNMRMASALARARPHYNSTLLINSIGTWKSSTKILRQIAEMAGDKSRMAQTSAKLRLANQILDEEIWPPLLHHFSAAAKKLKQEPTAATFRAVHQEEERILRRIRPIWLRTMRDP